MHSAAIFLISSMYLMRRAPRYVASRPPAAASGPASLLSALLVLKTRLNNTQSVMISGNAEGRRICFLCRRVTPFKFDEHMSYRHGQGSYAHGPLDSHLFHRIHANLQRSSAAAMSSALGNWVFPAPTRHSLNVGVCLAPTTTSKSVGNAHAPDGIGAPVSCAVNGAHCGGGASSSGRAVRGSVTHIASPASTHAASERRESLVETRRVKEITPLAASQKKERPSSGGTC